MASLVYLVLAAIPVNQALVGKVVIPATPVPLVIAVIQVHLALVVFQAIVVHLVSVAR